MLQTGNTLRITPTTAKYSSLLMRIVHHDTKALRPSYSHLHHGPLLAAWHHFESLNVESVASIPFHRQALGLWAEVDQVKHILVVDLQITGFEAILGISAGVDLHNLQIQCAIKAIGLQQKQPYVYL